MISLKNLWISPSIFNPKQRCEKSDIHDTEEYYFDKSVHLAISVTVLLQEFLSPKRII